MSTNATSAPETVRPVVIVERIIYFLVAALLVLLAFRFSLSLLGANRGNVFANFIYDLSSVFVQPFFTLFSYDMQYGPSRVEFETLVAMVVYAVVGGDLVALIRLPRRDNSDTGAEV